MEKPEYRFAVPSYQRYLDLGKKTLTTLKENNIPLDLIDIFVADENEYQKYKELYPEYNIIIGRKGMKEIRKFYLLEYYKEGDKVVSLDDDIEFIKMKNPREWEDSCFEEVGCPDLSLEINLAFKECEKSGRHLWGVYPVDNHFFMKNYITYGYQFIIGHFWGVIIKKELCDLGTNQYEDYERSIKHYLHDGGVVRLNYLCCKTKYLTNKGGMGKERDFKGSLEYLINTYPDLVSIKKKKNGDNPLLKDRRSK